MEVQEYKELIKCLNGNRNLDFVGTEKTNEFCGNVTLHDGNTISMRIVFPSAFPLNLPVFYIQSNGLRFLHTDSNGKMCLFEESSILIKQNDPVGLLTQCFDKAIEILSINPASEEYRSEIKREFDSYWLGISNKELVYSTIDTDAVTFEEIKLGLAGSRRIVSQTVDEAKVVAFNYMNCPKSTEIAFKDCIIVKLRANAPLPKMSDIKWKDVRHYILDNVSGSIKRRFEKYCEIQIKSANKYIFLILSSNAGDIIFGYKIVVKNKRYEKFANCYSAIVSPVYVERIDEKYILRRSGVEGDDITNKSVLIMGCGSVGGFIADNFCAAGVENIDLLDDDFFSPENVHRHFLGMDAALRKSLRNKADVLKERLEDKYLYSDIDSLGYKDRRAETLIKDVKKLSNYDLIISAMGEPTINLEINRILYKNGIKTPFLVCFNEPYGIGGHAIAVNINHESCLKCLYTDSISDDLVEYRGSFVKPGQMFKKNISGCGSAFVPYNRLDSQQTAIIATRLGIDILNGIVTENVIKSWVGDSARLKAAGKTESEYYHKYPVGTIYDERIHQNLHCDICREEGIRL